MDLPPFKLALPRLLFHPYHQPLAPRFNLNHPSSGNHQWSWQDTLDPRVSARTLRLLGNTYKNTQRDNALGLVQGPGLADLTGRRETL